MCPGLKMGKEKKTRGNVFKSNELLYIHVEIMTPELFALRGVMNDMGDGTNNNGEP